MSGIFRSVKGRQAWRALYDRRVAQLPMPTGSIEVDTRYGRTHVLTAGPSDASEHCASAW